jgi:hypothetical protein
MEAATNRQPTEPVEGVSSLAESLFLSEIHEQLVFPYPRLRMSGQRQGHAVTRPEGGCRR